MTDADLLAAVLDGDHELAPVAREAFTRWRERAGSMGPLLTAKQRAWLYDVAMACKVVTDPGAANLFSGLSPQRQAEQRAAAAKVRLPWEK